MAMGVLLPAKNVAVIKKIACFHYIQVLDEIIFAFFALEMVMKMIAMGVIGKGTYLAETWNRLDFFIVLAG